MIIKIILHLAFQFLRVEKNTKSKIFPCKDHTSSLLATFSEEPVLHILLMKEAIVNGALYSSHNGCTKGCCFTTLQIYIFFP